MTGLTLEPIARFQDMPIGSSLKRALAEIQFTRPTPIQSALIPVALEGRDCIGQARTGTGKTGAFLIPIFETIDPTLRATQALILAPTRELVRQIGDEANLLQPPDCGRTVTIYGGQRMGGEFEALRRGAHVVAGTPGRLLDHIGRGTLRLDAIRWVVLDEADRMLDIGFRPDIERILGQIRGEHQTLLLSATLPPPVLHLARRYMHDPVAINLSPTQITVETIRQRYLTVDQDRKFELLLRVIDQERPRQCIIFCQTKRGVDRLGRKLIERGQKVASMHGDLPQWQRNEVMDAFRAGKLRFLVATDVVGRGIDVENISHVINYDIPLDPENYVHRIGRTGRMGADGSAILFVTPGEGESLTAIEHFINQVIERYEIPDFEAFSKLPPKAETVSVKAEAIREKKRKAWMRL